MSEEEIIKLINDKIYNNPNIEKFVIENNKPLELDFEKNLLDCDLGFISREDYIFLLQLGIPIGIIEYVDSTGSLLFDGLTIDEGKDPVDPVKHIYKPINNLKEYEEYLEIDPYPHIIVNPNYLNSKEVGRLWYCLYHSNNDEIFDFNTKNRLQMEIINSLPLKYDVAMKIFNKYYDVSIQKKFIYKYGIERERFYEISGLNELVPTSKKSKKFESRGER